MPPFLAANTSSEASVATRCDTSVIPHQIMKETVQGSVQ